MSSMELLFPRGSWLTTEELLTGLGKPPTDGPLRFGDERIVDFLDKLARRLLRAVTARRLPELASLGFLLRRSALSQLLDSLAEPAEAVRRPRGLVFHVPPSNVDSLFAYSWAHAALAGNANVVRVSSRASGAAAAILDVLHETALDAHPAIGQTQRMVAYPHDDTTTRALSAACDLRVLWGGDATVDAMRRMPIPAHARDLTFPDRSSLAVVNAAAWLAADPQMKQAVAVAFYNDTYWFDQAACSSPRAVYWIGEPAVAERAQRGFYRLLRAIVAQAHRPSDAAMAVERQVATYGLAIDGAATAIRSHHSALMTVELATPEAFPRRWLGAGVFPQATVAHLNDVSSFVTFRDQTVTYFGFTQEELAAFVRAIPGRGVDRVVPIGAALRFASVWDGHDLLREFTRLTTVVPPRSRTGW